METIRVTKAQKFEAMKKMLDAMSATYAEVGKDPFEVRFPGTETREGYTFGVEQAKEFCDSELDILARKNSSSSDPTKLTAAQKENLVYKDEIKAFLGTLPEYDENDADAKKGFTATEILTGTSLGAKGFQISKVTSLLTQLGKGTSTRPGSMEVERIVGKKGVALFRLAK